MNNWLSKYGILLIVFLALIVRLYHIDFPVAGFQAWRQADTAAMARNFYEQGFNFFYPQIDWGGNTDGYVETEFPLYPFVVALLYFLFHPDDLWGRLLSVFCSLWAVYGLYLLVRKILGETTALWAASIYAILPLNVFYTRAFMPESAMLMCSVWGIYLFSEWLDKEKMQYWFASLLFISLAALLKISALYLGLPLLFLAWTRYGTGTLKNWRLWTYAALVFVSVGLWYYHAHQIYLNTGLSFGIWFFGEDKWGIASPLLTLKFYNDVFMKSIAERHLTYAGFIPFLTGLLLTRTTSREKLFDWWLITVLIFFMIVSVGNQVHEYYQLPFVLPAVVFVAKTFNRYFSKEHLKEYWKKNRPLSIVFGLCLVAIPILSFLRVSNFMKGERLDSSLFHLEKAVQESTDLHDLVVTVDQYDPIVLYRVKRKGWHAVACGINDDFLLECSQLGAKYLIGQKETFFHNDCTGILDSLLQRYDAVRNTDGYFILKLHNSS
ncbi:MAG: glycosyltransferase family 39 protein [Ignavibacteriae bacterium]|nr:glycosyltransferase family 39 protein [Ignavibacteriota bacterium]